MNDKILSFLLSMALLFPNTTPVVPAQQNTLIDMNYVYEIEEENPQAEDEQLPIEDAQPEVEETITDEPEVEETIKEEPVIEETPPKPEEPIKSYNPNTHPSKFTEADIRLMALVTIAEAEAECELGKRLVIDTILNCMDSEQFPNTVYEIVYRKNHFSSMWNGRVDQCVVTEDVIQLVREEIKDRTNYEVMFFRTKHYHNFGTPIMHVGNHWFSGE